MLKELVGVAERFVGAFRAKAPLSINVPWGRAKMRVTHRRPDNFLKDAVSGLFVPEARSFKMVDEPEEVWNLITFPGRDFIHVQAYGSSGLGANGLNWIALSNDAVTETTASTVLSNEIVANGLSRAQGTVAHTSNTNTTTVDKTFTNTTSNQAAQKAALLSASSAGTLCHVLAFSQRSLIVGDTLELTFTLTCG